MHWGAGRSAAQSHGFGRFLGAVGATGSAGLGLAEAPHLAGPVDAGLTSAAGARAVAIRETATSLDVRSSTS